MDALDRAVADDKKLLNDDVERMKSLSVASGSLKSIVIWLTLDTIDQCGQACGGHGYSSYAGFGKAFNYFALQCTWEGDNNILGMSLGKQLLKKYAAAKKGEVATGVLAFFGGYKRLLGTQPVLEKSDLSSPRKILAAV